MALTGGRGEAIDREHPLAGRDKYCHSRPSAIESRIDERLVVLNVSAGGLLQFANAEMPSTMAPFAEHEYLEDHREDIVMVLGQSIPTKITVPSPRPCGDQECGDPNPCWLVRHPLQALGPPQLTNGPEHWS